MTKIYTDEELAKMPVAPYLKEDKQKVTLNELIITLKKYKNILPKESYDYKKYDELIKELMK